MGFLLGIEGLDLNPSRFRKSTDFPLTRNFIVVGDVGELTETEREGQGETLAWLRDRARFENLAPILQDNQICKTISQDDAQRNYTHDMILTQSLRCSSSRGPATLR